MGAQPTKTEFETVCGISVKKGVGGIDNGLASGMKLISPVRGMLSLLSFPILPSVVKLYVSTGTSVKRSEVEIVSLSSALEARSWIRRILPA